MSDKRKLGQYYTQANPFRHELFREWYHMVPLSGPILEPFAGANNIPLLMREAGYDVGWKCYDIAPPDYNETPEYPVEQRDTLASFPDGGVVITNPPYLGKSSARRRHIEYPWAEDDLYKTCLNVMLSRCGHVAAIIPESFITAKVNRDRLWGVISLNCEMFDDTDEPVCLAMFTPEGSGGHTRICTMDEDLGELEDLERRGFNPDKCFEWTFNDPKGPIGVKAVDSQTGPDCRFMPGDEIPSESIKVSSRSFTRISGPVAAEELEGFLEGCNDALEEYRTATKDVLLTSFKGLRRDGRYRRRLDFGTIRSLMDVIRGRKS